MTKKDEKYVISDITKYLGRIISGAYYDYQGVRIATNSRIRDLIRKKVEGIPFDKVEEKKDKKNKKKKYKDEELMKMWKKLLENDKISQKEYEYVKQSIELSKKNKNLEKKYEKMMMEYIKPEPVYQQFLSKIRGIGPVLSANLIKSFGDCSKYQTVSKLRSHTGNHVVDKKAPRLKKGKKAKFNPELRTMTWMISDCLLKHNKGIYRQIYDSEKEKQLVRAETSKCEFCGKNSLSHVYDKSSNTYYCPKNKEQKITLENFTTNKEDGTPVWSNGHAHNRALRKMRKIFLDHYWHASRELNGLPAKKSFVDGVLGHEGYISWREAVEKENEIKFMDKIKKK